MTPAIAATGASAMANPPCNDRATAARNKEPALGAPMPPRRKQPVAEEPCGKAKLLDLASLRKEGAGIGKASTGKMKFKPTSVATWTLIKAKYQKGDKTGQYSGAVYYRGKPRYGQNEKYKEVASAVLLSERLRWNDELKLYTVRVYTATQARKLLAVLKELDGGEKDLPDDIDETVFTDASPTDITVFPITVHEGPTSQNQAMIAVAGSTYPFKDTLKERGFAFSGTVNDEEGVNLWLAPQDEVDQAELVALFEEYGFTVKEFDGVQ